MPNLHNKYRGQMLVMSLNRQKLHLYLQSLEPLLYELQVVTAIDVDPLEL
jgi:primosomal protein N'